MATVGDNLKANIRIGGTIDPSWKNSVEGLKKDYPEQQRKSPVLPASRMY